MDFTSSYSNPSRLVLQIIPELQCGLTQVGDQQASRTAVMVFIPKTNSFYISCPLNYFQERVSLTRKWILDDKNNKINLEFINNLNKVIITEAVNGVENIINIPTHYNKRLLNYFKLDICHNSAAFIGFDCYAFISLIANVKYFPKNPEFNYEEKEPTKGDFIVLADSDSLPDSIKHWALYLGSDRYLSKLGRSGEGAQSLLEVMDLNGMKTLYKSKFVFVANPKVDARQWEEYDV